jgi:Zn-dependent protease with chaperone function
VLLALIFAVPLVGVATAEGLKAQQQYDQRSKTNAPDRLEQLCETPSSELRDVCTTRTHLALLEDGSLFTGLLGSALLVAIRIAGWAARRRRSIYVKALRSVVPVTRTTIVVVAALQASIAVAILGLAARAVFGPVPVGLLVALSLAATAVVATIARATFSLMHRPVAALSGARVDPDRERRLYERIERLARLLGARPPQQVVARLEPCIFTTDAPDRTLCCSLPLVRVLSLPEFDALVAHELRHPRIDEPGLPEHRSLAQAPATAILAYVHDAFAQAKDKVAREQELAADRDAARVAGPLDVATAFAKLHAMAELWARIEEAAAHKFPKARSPRNVSKAAAELAVAKGIVAASDPKGGAISLIDGVETLEQQLSAGSELSVEAPPERKPTVVPRQTALR